MAINMSQFLNCYYSGLLIMSPRIDCAHIFADLLCKALLYDNLLDMIKSVAQQNYFSDAFF